MNIMIVGVGGQGTLLASRVIGNVALSLGFDVKMSEVHGMSQRGGSVVTYIKFSDSTVSSPIISENSADFILGFELLEGYRYLNYLKKDAKLLINNRQVNPMPVITGDMAYPPDILQKLINMGVDVVAIDALALAQDVGNKKAMNIVLIGLLARQLDIAKKVWIESLKQTIPPKLLDINLKAFEAGYIAD